MAYLECLGLVFQRTIFHFHVSESEGTNCFCVTYIFKRWRVEPETVHKEEYCQLEFALNQKPVG